MMSPHLTEAKINRVQQGRGPFWHRIHESPSISSTDWVKIGDFLRLISKCDHERLVLRIRCLEELNHRLSGSLDLARHAAADVKDGAQGNGSILTRKVPNFLPFLALEHLEVLFI
jgi:hypothetical protein